MARAPFSIFKRLNPSGKTVYCARFFDETGAIIKTVVLEGAKSPTGAAKIADKMMKDGVVAQDANPPILDYLKSFWRADSEYVRNKGRERGTPMSAEYLKINSYMVSKHLSAHLKGKRLLDLRVAFIKQVRLAMDSAGASPCTINTAMQALKVPYSHFCYEHGVADQLRGMKP